MVKKTLFFFFSGCAKMLQASYQNILWDSSRLIRILKLFKIICAHSFSISQNFHFFSPWGHFLRYIWLYMLFQKENSNKNEYGEKKHFFFIFFSLSGAQKCAKHYLDKPSGIPLVIYVFSSCLKQFVLILCQFLENFIFFIPGDFLRYM